MDGLGGLFFLFIPFTFGLIKATINYDLRSEAVAKPASVNAFWLPP